MNAQRFTLSICFPESEVTATRLHANASDAKKWGQLCLDICGKDERGRLYLVADLLDAEGAILKTWASREADRCNTERHPYVTMRQWTTLQRIADGHATDTGENDLGTVRMDAKAMQAVARAAIAGNCA